MTERRKYDLLNLVSPILTIVTLIIGGIIWFHTMAGIPPRVDKAEDKISELEKKQAVMEAKADLTLNAIYEVRSIIMDKK